uniref:Translin-associated factor X-interacting protein 1 N-terminal domain-containing protein n=1 Tax=Tetraselmis chuii TaxID=63592 RepID=A0A7S1T9R7_9CHLO|mmetsp:Transcript_7867/g.14117  ORF Transcript_7867/g.14117 Transcript_7867/m.14117 type:complete len:299 (+) Transcript_7867:309-1205(+)
MTDTELPHLQTSSEVDIGSHWSPTQDGRHDILRSSIVDSIHRSHVVRDISPKRVYAANKESHATLPALFKQPKALEHLRPLKPNTRGGDDGTNRQPRLLQRLEHLLQEKLRMADTLSLPYNASASNPQAGASNIRLDAYRQAFEAFIHSFTTYRPLLLRIKSQYDAALDDALESAQENIHMRAELTVVEQRRLKSVEEARVNTNAELSEARRDLEQRLLEAEERAAAAEDRIRDAEAEAREARAEEERALQEYEELSERIKQLRRDIVGNSTWGKALAEKEAAHAAKMAKKLADEEAG